MQVRKMIFKRGSLVLLVLLLAALLVAPASAQGPEGEDGTAGMALSFHSGYQLVPASQFPFPPGTPGAPFGIPGVPQFIESGLTATTEFAVTDVEDLYSVNLAFDYNDNIVEVVNVEAGSLFDSLTPGVDYQITVSPPAHAEHNPGLEPTIPPPPHFATNVRVYVNIYVYNYANPTLPVRGNGSLIKINWHNVGGNLGATTPVDFTIAKLADEYGNYIEPCYPVSLCRNTNDPPQPDPNVPPNHPAFWNLIGQLQVAPPAGTPFDKFQVSLEGGKAATQPPAAEAAEGSIDGGVTFLDVDANSKLPFTTPPPYTTLRVQRTGYLDFVAVNISPADQPLITLAAGDINNDARVDIADLAQIAGLLNMGVVPATEKMDYNADNIITISDLALVAKNYGMVEYNPMTLTPTPTSTPTPIPPTPTPTPTPGR